jgi:hypothetical protein
LWGGCLCHYCGHWAIFSQKHLVTLTFDERVTFVESVPTKGPGYWVAQPKLGQSLDALCT